MPEFENKALFLQLSPLQQRAQAYAHTSYAHATQQFTHTHLPLKA